MRLKSTLIIATTLFANNVNADQTNLKTTNVYLSVEYGQQKSKLESGGFNTAGNFSNSGNDEDKGNTIGLKIGLDLKGKWRFDLGYRNYKSQDYTTDSFLPPTPTFFYVSKAKAKTIMVTAYYDLFKFNKLKFYGGVGIGASDVKISTNDLVVRGSANERKFSWQTEFGAQYPVTNNLKFNIGLRYVDLGKSKINLETVDGAAPAGDFTAEFTSREVFIGLRYNF